MRKWTGIASLVLAVAAALLLPAPGVAQPVKIRFVVSAPTLASSHAPHTSLPQVLGYWKEEGLDVSIETSQGSNQAVQFITLGQADVSLPSPEPVLIGRSKGSRVKAVYVYSRRSVYSIAVAENSPVRTMADLKGKSVGVPNLGSGSVPFVKATAARAGLNAERDITLLPVGLGAQAASALLANRVSGLALWDAAYAAVENLGHRLRYLENPLEQDLYGVIVAFSEDFIGQHPRAVVGFCRGIAKATLFALTNPEAAVKLHWTAYPQYKSKAPDEATALRYDLNIFNRRAVTYRLESPTTLWGSHDPKKWELFQDFLLTQGVLPAKRPVTDYYDDRFIKEINAFDREAVVKAAASHK